MHRNQADSIIDFLCSHWGAPPERVLRAWRSTLSDKDFRVALRVLRGFASRGGDYPPEITKYTREYHSVFQEGPEEGPEEGPPAEDNTGAFCVGCKPKA